MKKCKHCGKTYPDYKRTCPYCEESNRDDKDSSYSFSSSSSFNSYSYDSSSSFDGGCSDGGGCSGDF